MTAAGGGSRARGAAWTSRGIPPGPRVPPGPRIPPGPRELVLAGLAACAGFALLGKVLSPQFVIWVVPLGALAFAWRMHALAVAVALVALLTQIEFPAHYFDVVAREPAAVGVVALRNLALAAVIALTARELRAARDAPRRAVAA